MLESVRSLQIWPSQGFTIEQALGKQIIELQQQFALGLEIAIEREDWSC